MMPPRSSGRYTKARVAAAPYRVIGTAPEPAFDVFVHLICAALGVPSALLGFFDGETLCIKAVAGRLHRNEFVAAGLRDAFERETSIVISGETHFFCAAPVATQNGQVVGVIAGFDDRAHATTSAQHATIETIANAVTHALEARKHTTADAGVARALFAFDAADLSVVFADADTARQRIATPAQLQMLAFDDVFSGIDARTRHELDIMRETMGDVPLAFTARTLGTMGFWFPVACTARAVRARTHSLIVIEYAQSGAVPERPPVRALARINDRRSRWEGHSIEAVLSKIEAGRRALRAELGEIDEPLTGGAFVSAAAQLLADHGEPHVLAVFAPGADAIAGAIERARRVRLLCDHDLVAVFDRTYVAMLLRDMPLTIGHQAVKRFARSLPNVQFAVRDTSGPNESVRNVLEDAIAALRITI
jgi:hypothetical protein